VTTTARYPDLAGKVAIVTGTHADVVLDVVRAFVANQMPVAVVAPDHDAMNDATDLFNETALASGVAVTGDPSDGALWQRIAPHTEQRLGPIDIVVLAGDRATHDVVVAALLPDMAARRRGVLVEVGKDLQPRATPPGVHHFLTETAADVVRLAAIGSK
jgi:NAD(P)-dependent dehydrogenase (short-subunit alcohol dehydrogenase family)